MTELEAWKAILSRPVITSNPLSPNAIFWAQSRLEIYNRAHISCRSQQQKRLPKRLLSLAPNAKGDIDTKLVEIKSNFCNAYVALSHCWGNERGLVTTEHTLKSHQSLYIGFLYQSLSKTQ